MNEKLKKLARQDEIASMIDGCRQAFPSNLIDGSLHIAGMTLRDYFAAKSLNGMLAHSRNGRGYRPTNPNQHWHEAIAQEAYALADAMMKAREK